MDFYETSVVAEEGYVARKDNSMCGVLAQANEIETLSS